MKYKKEDYLTKYADDPMVLELIKELEETDEKFKKLEIDASKMSMVLATFAEEGNWKQNKIFGTDENHSVFVGGKGMIGKKLVNYIANQMNLM